MLAFTYRAFLCLQPQAEYVFRLETGFVEIASAQDSIWSFDKSIMNHYIPLLGGCYGKSCKLKLGNILAHATTVQYPRVVIALHKLLHLVQD